ncbi:MAG: hypothetical protein Q9187_005479 [Circinaria calcarea]
MAPSITLRSLLPVKSGEALGVGRGASFQKSKLMIKIILTDDQQYSFVPSYTTLDKIEGFVSITALNDLGFEDIHITFQGTSKTFVDAITTAPSSCPRTEAYHNFLKLFQPIDGAALPPDRVLEAGQTYRFPFTFVVPEHLLPHSCTHPRDHEGVHNAHLALPPSLGDPVISGNGTTLLDDLAPKMALVSYALRVIVTRRQGCGDKPCLIADSVQKLRIIPASEIQPPLAVLGVKGSGYCLRKEKDVKKGMFKGKLGRLAAEAEQPKSLSLPSVRSSGSCPVTTMTAINIRFDPVHDHARPPRLNSLVSKLKVRTFYSSAPFRSFPTKSATFLYDPHHGTWSETVHLSCRNVESVAWTAHDSSIPPSQQPRRESLASITSDSIPIPSKAPVARVFYTSQILVPINLPVNSKTFVPTFHSCLISRTYTLDLSLPVGTLGKAAIAPTIHLQIPLQISAKGNVDARPIISEAEAQAIAAREVDQTLLPRNMGPPSPEYLERADLARASSSNSSSRNVDPPGYSTSGGQESGRDVEPERYPQIGQVPLRLH